MRHESGAFLDCLGISKSAPSGVRLVTIVNKLEVILPCYQPLESLIDKGEKLQLYSLYILFFFFFFQSWILIPMNPK